MAKTENRIEKRRLRGSYVTSTISISLVLFLLGLVCMLLLNTKRLSDYVKENIGFSVILKDHVKEVDIISLKKSLDASAYVKSSEYITKEQAAEETRLALGEDFIEFLGTNPLPASIEVKLFASYANPDSLEVIEARFKGNELVKEVSYQKNLVHLVNENVRKISFFILIVSAVLFVIAFALINNTIRLAVYARRFLINTMQLVGATYSFIRKPFLISSILHGIYGALLAILYLIGFIYFLQGEFNEYLDVSEYHIIGVLFGTVILMGIVITSLSTYFAVNRYLGMKSDDLYY